VFRSSAEGIGVHVSVRDRNRPVGGLTAADFDVLDNGVRQTITAAAIESVPIDSPWCSTRAAAWRNRSRS
jgi:hypothetical protein